VKIFNKELLDGVAQFTLFAPTGEPVCERLVFVDNPDNDAELQIAAKEGVYGLREKVALNMSLTDTKGVPLSGDFSMGVVTKSNELYGRSDNADIRSWLLLDSDLGGTIPDPDFFFADNSEQRQLLLDALMLTHGWRRFVWADLLNNKTNRALAYKPEKGIMVTGKTTKLNNAFNPKRTVASLTLFGDDLLHGEQATNDQGRFSFGPYIFTDSVAGIVQAFDSLAKREYKKKDFSIFLDSPWPELHLAADTKKRVGRETLAYDTEYLKESYRKKVNDFKYDPKVTQLDEVVVVDKKWTRVKIINKATGAALTNGPFSRRTYTDSIPGGFAMSAMDILHRTGGVRVYGQYPRQTVRRSGISSVNAGKEPLYLLDGMATSEDVIQPLRANEVMFVDVVYGGSDLALWGQRGASGVIAFYTNRGISFEDKELDVPGITNFEIPGFYKVREFYVPNYSEPKPEHEKPDYRTTLYWDPNVRIGQNGRSNVDFYTGDSPGTYRIKIEGITQDGRPVSGYRTFEVHESN
ncbi:MAG: hypothetical protein WBM83_11845, partial [Flavobacteriaceae bacterium]